VAPRQVLFLGLYHHHPHLQALQHLAAVILLAIALGPMVAAAAGATMEATVGRLAVAAVVLLAIALGPMAAQLVVVTMEVPVGISAVVLAPRQVQALQHLARNGAPRLATLWWHMGLLNCKMEVGQSRATVGRRPKLLTICWVAS
jgi:hypothetical protein